MLSSLASSRPLVSTDSLPSIRWSYLIVALVIAFTSWVSFIHPPDGGYFTTDEQFIADSGMFLIYGATPRCIDWPCIPLVFVFYLMSLGLCLINVISAAMDGNLTAVGVFEIIDKTAYTYLLDRIPLIMAGRFVQILLVGGLLIWCTRIIHRASAALLPPVLRLPLVVIICLQYDVLVGTPVMRPEALSYSLFAVITLLIFFGEFPKNSLRQPATVLLLMALLISHRLTFLFTMPLLLGGLLVRVGWNLKRALALAGTLLLFVLATIPFLWTDTFVLIKAFAGGMIVKLNGTHGKQPTFFNWQYVRDMVLPTPTVWQLILLPIGALAIWRRYPYRGIAALLLGNLVLLSIAILHSSTIYIPHTLPLRTLGLLLLAYGCYSLYQLTNRRWVLYGLTALLAISNITESVNFGASLLRPWMFWQAVDFLKTLPANTPVLVESEFDNLTPRSPQALTRELAAIQDQRLTQAKYNRLFSGKSATSVPVVLETSLSEDERLGLLQRQILVKYTPMNKYADLYYFSPATGFVNYFVEQKPAFADFVKGRYTYLITHEQLPYPRVAQFDQPSHGGPYYVYKTPAALPASL